MSEQAQSVEEALAAAAAATEGATVPKAKKERKPKEAKEPKVKLYKQWNEDGTPKLNEDGTQAMGPEKMKRPKRVSAPRSRRVILTLNGEEVTLHKIQNDAEITLKGDFGSREGSKRAERAKAFTGAATVQDFFANGGVSKDILRLMLAGKVELTVKGVQVVAAPGTTKSAE